jgi:CheY-like chemotaxis protein
MNKYGPIIIIEDDDDDLEVLRTVYKKLNCKNRLVFIKDGELAANYFENMDESPFLIISDINIPKINGIQLLKMVRESSKLNAFCIPYIMLSTSAEQKNITDAFALGVQGFFQKPASYAEIQDLLQSIIDYWQRSYSPGRFVIPVPAE